MLGLFAQSMFVATCTAHLVNSATGHDWRASSSPKEKLNQRKTWKNAMQSTDITNLRSRTGKVERVWQIEIQATPEDVDKIIDKVMEVDPLIYGRYQRNAFVSAVGRETYLPEDGSTSAVHLGAADKVQTFPSVLIVISIEQNPEILTRVLDAIREVHHYEEPLIFIKDCWASRASYDPHNTNPNRWWNRDKNNATA